MNDSAHSYFLSIEKKRISAIQRYVPSRVLENFGGFQGCKGYPVMHKIRKHKSIFTFA